MDWTATAAFTAAALSLGNVVISARLVRRGRLEQWRQDEERPIVARMLVLSGDAVEEWRTAGYARSGWLDSLSADASRQSEDTVARDKATEHWRTGSELFDKLRFELAQLDLIAGPALREVAAVLVREHESVQHWIRPASGADDSVDLLTEHSNRIVQLHGDFLDQARTEFGVDRMVVRRRLRSFLPPYRRRPWLPMP